MIGRRYKVPYAGDESKTYRAVSSVTWLAIYFTLGNFSKPVALIILPKSPTFLGNFCKGVEIFHFSSEIIFGQPL